jgi:hypothetical protein
MLKIFELHSAKRNLGVIHIDFEKDYYNYEPNKLHADKIPSFINCALEDFDVKTWLFKRMYDSSYTGILQELSRINHLDDDMLKIFLHINGRDTKDDLYLVRVR